MRIIVNNRCYSEKIRRIDYNRFKILMMGELDE